LKQSRVDTPGRNCGQPMACVPFPMRPCAGAFAVVHGFTCFPRHARSVLRIRSPLPGSLAPRGYPRALSLRSHGLKGHPAPAGLSGHPCPSGQSLPQHSASFTETDSVCAPPSRAAVQGSNGQEVQSRPPRAGRPVRPTPEVSRYARVARRAGDAVSRFRK